MHVKEVMSNRPEFLPPTTPLIKITEEMRLHDFGFVPIGENDRLIGVVTDRDVAIRGVGNGKDPNSLQAKDVMTKKVLYCYEDDNIKDAAESMCKQQVHRLIVLNKDKRMTGILSLGDIARKSKNEKLSGHIIEAISQLH
jgi:CBS domain-containing protein